MWTNYFFCSINFGPPVLDSLMIHDTFLIFAPNCQNLFIFHGFRGSWYQTSHRNKKNDFSEEHYKTGYFPLYMKEVFDGHFANKVVLINVQMHNVCNEILFLE